ncbi:hypothetical protein [Pseudomonas sp.]|uniref:hypothetical protein n=1 Tax=Pseudomonas sp. TaxID=306 RepID=UPI003D6F86B6
MSEKAKLKVLAEAGAANGNWMELEATSVLALLAEIERLSKIVESIDKKLRGNVVDPDPLPPILPGALSISTTYGLVAGIIRERDQLKIERDRLREDRDGLLEAGAHLL